MSFFKNLPQRDILAISVSLFGVTLLSWVYLVSIVATMDTEGGMKSIPSPEWDATYFLMMFLMWAIMMVGMMMPSITPTVLIYAAVLKKSARQGMHVAPVSAFVFGYLVMWFLFSMVATLAQWGLDTLSLLSPMMVAKSGTLAAILLVTAGIYQWLPVKERCLVHCRSPIQFISRHWRSGNLGAFQMGVHHGSFCLGCCWLIMSLLFVGGVMNLIWIGILTLFVLLEKLLPYGPKGGRFLGAVMITAGIFFYFKMS